MQNYSDLEDEYSFGLLLKSTREYYGINQSKLAKGIISVSRLSMIENGKREADYKLRNRLLGRLGYTLEGFEEFLKISDYKRYEKYSELTDAVEKNDNMALQLVNELIGTRDKEDIVEYQFLLDMYARSLWHNKVNKKEIENIYQEAIQLTMAGINENNIDEYALAPEEYYLLITKAEFMEADSSFDKLSILVNHLRNKELGDIAKAKVYPKAVYLYSRWILKLYPDDDSFITKALEHSSKAIDILVNAGRLYYLYDLLKIRKELFIHLDIQNEEILKEREENLRYLSSLEYFYSYLPEKKTMENDCYIYRSGMCYYVGDIIYKRRNMLGMSRNELAKGICSTRTLLRIENMQADAQWSIISELLGRLHLPMQICRGDLVTSDFNLLIDFSILTKLDDNKEYEKADEILRGIKERLNLSNEMNAQFIQEFECLRLYKTNKIDKKALEENIWKILDITGINKKNAFDPKGYYTWIEKNILFHIAKNKILEKQFITYVYEAVYNSEKNVDYPHYEMVMELFVRLIEDAGKMEEAVKIRREIMIKYLENNRPFKLAINAINLCCSEACVKADYKDKKYIDQMEKIIAFCDLIKKKLLKEAIEKCLIMAKNGDDWT